MQQSDPQEEPMPPFMIVPAARPDLALTLVTENGAAALALLPRQPGNRMQLFDNVPADFAAAEPDASPHALLVKAGALSGIPTPPADARGQAQILDFAIALAISLVNPQVRLRVIGEVAIDAIRHRSLARIIVHVAHSIYHIQLDEGVVARYIDLLKQKTANKPISAFLKSAQGNPALMNQIARAGTDYAALAKLFAAHGVAVSAQDVQSYFAPWKYYTQVLDGLKATGAINQAKYDEAMGYQPGEYNISGMGPDVDQQLIQAYLSASSWAAKVPGFGDFSMPMQALMVPFATAMADQLSGQASLQLKQLGPMMVQGILQAFQSTADGLQSFGSDLTGLFR